MKYIKMSALLCFCITVTAQKNTEPTALHNNWTNCFVISIKGDTVYGRVQNRDFSFVSRDFRQPAGVTVALADHTEIKLKADDITQLNVATKAGGYVKYLSLMEGKRRIIYKVVIDGTCSLLHNSKEGLIYPSPNSQPISVVTENYTVYYKGQLAEPVNEKEVYMIPAPFRKKCGKFFADCPQLAADLAGNNYYSDNLYEIVAAFNKCINGN